MAVRFYWHTDIVFPPNGGSEKPAYQHIIDMDLDNVVVMGYRDYAAGIIPLDQDEIAYANSQDKANLILVGVETSDCAPGCGPEYVTFFEEGQVAMNNETAIVTEHFATSPSFGGFAVHRYGDAYLSGNSPLWPAYNTFKTVPAHVFYNNSAFDGNAPEPNPEDDHAIATDKEALMPGGTATFDNFTSYSRGINGVMIDISGLPTESMPGEDDFEFKFGNNNHPGTWSTGPSLLYPPAVRPGAGENGSDRVTLTWDDNAIPTRNWLQVTVKATPNTGLDQDEVFYFGNSIGDADGDRVAACADMYAIYQQLGQPAAVDNPLDIDRDGFITQADMDAVFPEVGRLPILNLITVPSVVATGDAAATDKGSGVDGSQRSRGSESLGPRPVGDAAVPLAMNLGAGNGAAGADGTSARDRVFSGSIVPQRTGGSGLSPGGAAWLPDQAAPLLLDAWRPMRVPEGKVRQVQRPLGLRPLDDRPAPLVVNLDARENAAGINKTSARDAVLGEATEREGLETPPGKWDWLWWHEFEQMRARKRSSKQDNVFQQAADELLAAQLR